MMGHVLGRLFGLFWGCRFEVSVAYYINGRELMRLCVCRTALLLITGDLMVRLEIEDK